jgi:hypothetical protein
VGWGGQIGSRRRRSRFRRSVSVGEAGNRWPAHRKRRGDRGEVDEGGAEQAAGRGELADREREEVGGVEVPGGIEAHAGLFAAEGRVVEDSQEGAIRLELPDLAGVVEGVLADEDVARDEGIGALGTEGGPREERPGMAVRSCAASLGDAISVSCARIAMSPMIRFGLERRSLGN